MLLFYSMGLDVERYRNNLFDIKKRTEVISEHLRGIRKTKYLITEVEFLCLQFRKTLELIALSSLVANKEEYSKQHAKFAKHYNARLIFQDLERINPDFYPRPTKQVEKQMEGGRYFDLQPIKSGFLTKEEFLKVYEKCGGMLHAENPYAQKRDIQKLREEFPEWINKIIKLLNHHNITLVDNKTMLIGLMHGKEDGQPHAFEFGVVDKEEDEALRKKIKKTGV